MFAHVFIDLAAALICFAGQCYPALVGEATPRGNFRLTHYSTTTPGYGGNILVFQETATELWGIHPVIDVPGQNRPTRLLSPSADSRIKVTAGCVNIQPDVMDLLIDCCSDAEVLIK